MRISVSVPDGICMDGSYSPRCSSHRVVQPLGQRDRYAKRNCIYQYSHLRGIWASTNLAAGRKVLALGDDALVVVDVVLPAVLGLVLVGEAGVEAYSAPELVRVSCHISEAL